MRIHDPARVAALLRVIHDSVGVPEAASLVQAAKDELVELTKPAQTNMRPSAPQPRPSLRVEPTPDEVEDSSDEAHTLNRRI